MCLHPANTGDCGNGGVESGRSIGAAALPRSRHGVLPLEWSLVAAMDISIDEVGDI